MESRVDDTWNLQWAVVEGLPVRCHLFGSKMVLVSVMTIPSSSS